MTLYTNLVPPDTLRHCAQCNKDTIFGYSPLIGHSRCRTCGCNLHKGQYRTLDPEHFKPLNSIPDTYIAPDNKDEEIHKLRCENGQLRREKDDLKTKMREQTKHLAILYEKIRGTPK